MGRAVCSSSRTPENIRRSIQPSVPGLQVVACSGAVRAPLSGAYILFDFRQLARPLAVQLSPTAPFSSYKPFRPAFLGVEGPPQLWPHPVEGVAHRGDRKQEGRGSLLGMSALQRTAGLVDVPGLKLCLSADTLVSEGSTVPRRSAQRRPADPGRCCPFPPGSLRTAGQGPIAAVRRSVVGGHWNVPTGGHRELPGDGQPDHAVSLRPGATVVPDPPIAPRGAARSCRADE